MDSATIRKPVEIHGRGLFSGEPCLVRIAPAPYGHGLVFRSGGVSIPALPAQVADAPACTVLERNGKSIRVAEHLLCALWAAGIDNAEITQLSGPEIPNVDGSSLPFYEALAAAGREVYNRRRKLVLNTSFRLGDDEAYFLLEPAHAPSIRYFFSHAELGVQEYEFNGERTVAVKEILSSRTFATLREATALQEAGLLMNTDESAGLLIRDGAPSQPLRFDNEYARHKVLDMLGDMYVLPFDWPCKVTAYRTGHQHNHQLARQLMREVERGALKLI
jgi:UDP-3-O-[3-hydroxymyristoyl] N-acetylglucosamine deacetylase